MLRLAVFAVCAATAQAAMSWKLCDDKASGVRVDSVSLVPYPAVRGQPLNMEITGTPEVPQQLSGGQLEISVIRAGHTLYKNAVDLCAGAASCTVSDDKVSVSYALTLPHITPVGAYEVALTAESGAPKLPGGNHTRFFCVNVDLAVIAPTKAAPLLFV